jgi:lantibiotic modifying enzyme
LASRATSLYERLAGGWTPDAGDDPLGLAQRRLERWRRRAAGGDWVRFRQRLAWDGLDEESALNLLRPGALAEEGDPPGALRHLPRWTETLAAALAEERAHPLGDSDGSSLAAPWVSVAEERLAQAAGRRTAWLSPLARQSLTRYLSDQLAAWITPAVDQPGWTAIGIYASQDRLRTLCQTYPVLARQLATRVVQWTDEIADFLARLAEDWPGLAQQTGVTASLGPEIVTGLRPGLSDPHRGGRTVWQVTFAHGPSVAYKPKPVQMDRALAELVGWAAQQGLADGPGGLWVLSRPGYGWMAWADAQVDVRDPGRLARRAGGLLGLLHLLHAADCHAENLVFRGGAPLLLDAEMLVYPQFIGQEADDPLDVMRTGLLPRWQVTRDGAAVFDGLDTADLDGVEVAAGYRDFCRFLAHRWPDLSGEFGPLAPFRQGRVRVALRPTQAYLRLLAHLRHPAFLSDGMDFSIETDRLAHAYLQRPAQARLWPLLADEHQALAQGDVPLFTGEIGSPNLDADERTVNNCLTWPPFTLPDPVTQAQQTGLIRESLDRSPYLTLTSNSFLEVARALGHLLVRRAVPLRSSTFWGSRTSKIRADPPNPFDKLRTPPRHPRSILGWISPQFQPKSRLHQHGLLGDDLYAGRAGIALFLAGLGRVTGEAAWGELALAGLAGADGTTDDPGGRIYALSLIGALLDAPELLAQASALAKTASQIDQAGVLDGQAGMVLGLLALHRAAGDDSALSQAIEWGDRLLAGEDGWRHPQRGLGGFSHGAAGIAHALARLHGASSAARFRDGAIRVWNFQQSFFDEAAGNWQDRRGEQPVYLHNWCNGAAGIGLATAGGLAILPGAEAAAERAAGLLIQADAPPFLDTLCCGGFGQIDCLLEMGRILGRQDWIDQATTQAQRALDQATAAGHFRLYDDLPAHLFNPGFFRGVAGVGYVLLRLAREAGENIPCVLSMEIERLRD